MMTDEAHDDFILQERLSGRSARSIGKQLSLSTSEVNASLDRTLPQIDNAMRLRHISLDLSRLDGLLLTGSRVTVMARIQRPMTAALARERWKRSTNVRSRRRTARLGCAS